MNITELLASVTTLLTRVGGSRVSGPHLLTAVTQVINYFATQIADIIPDWTVDQTFNTTGTGDGKYCKYVSIDTGIKRLFETLTDGNINHAPPSSSSVTENAYWREVSASASSSIKEWAAGVYGSELVIVYYDHSTDGKGLYLLTEATRPFSSTNIETELTAGKWEKIGTSLTLASVDTSASPVALDMKTRVERRFQGSVNITAARTFTLSNNSKALKLDLLFQVNGGVGLTFPASFKMNDALWDTAAHKWTSIDAGTYEASAIYNGTNWLLKINGPYN